MGRSASTRRGSSQHLKVIKLATLTSNSEKIFEVVRSSFSSVVFSGRLGFNSTGLVYVIVAILPSVRQDAILSKKVEKK